MARIKSYHEFKYLLNPRHLLEIQDFLRRFCRLDANGKDGTYEVMSLYYDTPDLQYYRDKTEGEYTKKKVRLRVYRTPGQDWQSAGLEIKRREGNKVYKTRTGIEALDICRFDQRAELKEILQQQRQLLIPSATVYYHRKAWESTDIYGLRFTLDQRLVTLAPEYFSAARELNFEQAAEAEKAAAVFEIKTYSEVPESIFRFLRQLNIKQVSFSKYATAVDRQIQRRKAL